MIYLGIDFGKEGALAAIKDDEVILLIDMPKRHADLIPILKRFQGANVTAAIEKVLTIYMPTKCRRCGMSYNKLLQSGKSLVTSALGVGYTLALADVFLFDMRQIRTSEWQKSVGVHGKKGKKAHIEAAKKLFPSAELKKRNKMLDGRADALLMAHYLRSQHETEKSI